jgi:hypothetical protein
LNTKNDNHEKQLSDYLGSLTSEKPSQAWTTKVFTEVRQSKSGIGPKEIIIALVAVAMVVTAIIVLSRPDQAASPVIDPVQDQINRT